MKTQPIEWIATLLQLTVFLLIIGIMGEALFDAGFLEAVQDFARKIGIEG